MRKTPPTTFKIGLIRGEGTGNRLADLFIDFLLAIVEQENKRRASKGQPPILPDFVEDKEDNGEVKIYHSFKSLVDAVGRDQAKFKEISEAEVRRLKNLMARWFEEGIRVAFRTSINAEALYLFRQEVKSIKEFTFIPTGDRKKKVLIVRDQAEGFYANTAYWLDDEEIRFEGKYTRAHQQKLIRHALRRSEEVLGKKVTKWAIYKHHLFGDKLEEWIKEVDNEIEVWQPDNGLTYLLNFVYGAHPTAKNNLLVICSNEVGDLIYESILGTLNIDAKLELFTKNILLEKPHNGEFKAYQTVHGSADDIAGTEKLLPYATLRIAADIAEKELAIPGIRAKTEKAIVYSKRKLLKETNKIVNCIYREMKLKP
ncbi:MAG: hypothetical protein H6558_18345 [Lewinellaceae bacterium]|nr:hypothetical protein [Lewinellaceae bacterium]